MDSTSIVEEGVVVRVWGIEEGPREWPKHIAQPRGYVATRPSLLVG